MQNKIYKNIEEILAQRKSQSLFRNLVVNELIDFCSNDYLSFARNPKIATRINFLRENYQHLLGATGSRSISGNTAFAEDLERHIASFHGSEAALLFNSGYDANVGLFSSIATKEDTIICDELIHASIIDGCRLSYANRFKFLHNDLNDLEKKLMHAKGNIFVAVESVYSMDGDMAPLSELATLCNRFGANLIVDEAHATGVFGLNGRGLVSEYGLEQDVFARIHTFGKALGCHGAAIVGSQLLREYLINFARSFIFTTALPIHSLFQIRSAYDQLDSADYNPLALHDLINYFRNEFKPQKSLQLIQSVSPVQCIVIPGSRESRAVALSLQQNGFDVRAITSPSVASGKERLRISLHLHNTKEEVEALLSLLNSIEVASPTKYNVSL